MDEQIARGQLRRVSNTQSGVLLIYRTIMTMAVCIVCLVYGVMAAFSAMLEEKTDFDALMESIMEGLTSVMGWGYLLAISVGLPILLLWKKPRWFAQLCAPGEKMKPVVFLAAICAMLAAQFFSQLSILLLDGLLGRFGISVTEFLVESSAGTDTPTMLFYIGIAAPITEEILFRGLVMRSFEPYGKQFAIFASALLFAMFHGNPFQIPFAFAMGILLGYLAQRYHIGWAVAVHLINNLVVGELLPGLLERMPYEVGNLLFWLLLIAGTAGAFVYALRHWESIERMYRQEDFENWQVSAFLASPCVIVLLVLCTIDALLVVGTLLLS